MVTSKIVNSFKMFVVLWLCLSGAACGGGSSVGASGNGGTSSGPDTVSFQVTWDIPVKYTDGLPLSLADIASYTLHYGTQSGNYTASVDITDPSITKYTITGLAHGEYFISITVKLVDGRESVYSNEVTRTI